jgi:hypothetical protein
MKRTKSEKLQIKRARGDFSEFDALNLPRCMINPNFVNYHTIGGLVASSINNKKKDIVYIRTYEQEYSAQTPCFYDNHTFDGPAFGMPMKWVANLDKFECWGKFCSLECVRAYINEQEEIRKDTKLSLLAMLGRKIYGRHIRIDPAPSRYILQLYGGPLSIEEYRENFSVNKLWVARLVNCGFTALKFDVYLTNQEFELYNRKEDDKKTLPKSKPTYILRREKCPAYLPKRSLLQMLGRKQRDAA